MTHTFVGLPKNGGKVHLYGYYINSRGLRVFGKIRQVLWGDWLSIEDGNTHREDGKDWLIVDWAPNSENRQTLYIEEKFTTNTRPLEIIFLDVGQGDGAILITPERDEDERILIIDAGEGDNMKKFIDGRFKAYRGFDFEAAIITHPDLDHYNGFREIFSDSNIGFKTLYQNGLIERPIGGEFPKFGGLVPDPNTGIEYIENLATTKQEISRLLRPSPGVNPNRYPFFRVMSGALANPKIQNFKMLSTDAGHSTFEDDRRYMPDFAPRDGKGYAIEVLGPVVERKADDSLRLRRLKSYAETKNGHSIILRLHFGKYKILFGGDLNIPAEEFLLKHYTEIDEIPDKGTAEYKDMITKASNWFGSEIMKVCHHGSEKVTDEFLKAVNPACFVISSGDQEGHVHPRPELLGRLGKLGRGDSPVLLSTELQRSTRESEDKKLITDLYKKIDNLLTDGNADERESQKEQIKEKIKTLSKTNVDVYGSIYLKTDGERLITAFKIEQESKLKKWFYFEYKIDDDGTLTLC